MNLTKKLVVAGSALAVTAAGVGVGVAYAAPTSSPTPSSSPSSSAAPQKKSDQKKSDQKKSDQHHRKSLAKRVLHGEVTLANKQHTVVDLQRGAVSAVSASSVTVKSADGFSQAYTVDARTKIVVVSGKTKAERKRTPAQLKDVTNGAKVSVVATKAGETRTAKRIVGRAG